MQYRQLGKTDIELPVVILGAWAIGGWRWGGTDEQAAIDAIRAGIDCGMNCVDTAPAYGFGLSEEIVGKAIKGRRDEIIVATKCSLRWDCDDGDYHFSDEDLEGNPVTVRIVHSRESLTTECERSLERLGVETIDLYQVHWPGKNSDFGGMMEILLDLKQQGKIRAIGVSNFSSSQMDNCLGHGPLDCCQPKYNLLERDAETETLPFCRKHTVGAIAYSPMELGLLTGKVTMERTFPESDIRSRGDSKPWFKPENRKRVLGALDRIKPIADGHSITLAQLALAWVIAQPGITSAIAGARRPEQAIENAKAGEVNLSEGELAILRREFEALGGPA